MRARLFMGLMLLCMLGVACSPARKCGGALYYDPENVSCRPCPMGARLKNGTCECPDDRVFKQHQCVAAASAQLDASLPDAALDAASGGSACAGYCELIEVCLGQSQFAQSVIPSVVSGLHGGMPEDCLKACAAVGGKGALAMCVAEGREAAACTGESSQAGLRGAIMLLADCSHAHPDDPLRPEICEGLVQSPLVADQIDFCD